MESKCDLMLKKYNRPNDGRVSKYYEEMFSNWKGDRRALATHSYESLINEDCNKQVWVEIEVHRSDEPSPFASRFGMYTNDAFNEENWLHSPTDETPLKTWRHDTLFREVDLLDYEILCDEMDFDLQASLVIEAILSSRESAPDSIPDSAPVSSKNIDEIQEEDQVFPKTASLSAALKHKRMPAKDSDDCFIPGILSTPPLPIIEPTLVKPELLPKRSPSNCTVLIEPEIIKMDDHIFVSEDNVSCVSPRENQNRVSRWKKAVKSFKGRTASKVAKKMRKILNDIYYHSLTFSVCIPSCGVVIDTE